MNETDFVFWLVLYWVFFGDEDDDGNKRRKRQEKLPEDRAEDHGVRVS